MSKDDQAIEQAEIQAKGADRARVTPQRIEEAAGSGPVPRFPRHQVTVCCLTLKNGFTVTGESRLRQPGEL